MLINIEEKKFKFLFERMHFFHLFYFKLKHFFSIYKKKFEFHLCRNKF